jgi:anti-sigma B factor antagonist
MPDRGLPFDQLIVVVDRHAQHSMATFRVRGQLDVATVPALRRAVEAALNEDVQRLVLDLSGVEFCDVPALNLLLSVQSRLSSRGGHLIVLGACRPLRIMVCVLGLEGRLRLMPAGAGDGAVKDDAQAG